MPKIKYYPVNHPELDRALKKGMLFNKLDMLASEAKFYANIAADDQWPTQDSLTTIERVKAEFAATSAELEAMLKRK